MLFTYYVKVLNLLSLKEILDLVECVIQEICFAFIWRLRESLMSLIYVQWTPICNIGENICLILTTKEFYTSFKPHLQSEKKPNFLLTADFSYRLCLVPRTLLNIDGSNPRSADATTFERPKLTTETPISVCKSEEKDNNVTMMTSHGQREHFQLQLTMMIMTNKKSLFRAWGVSDKKGNEKIYF